MVLRSCIRRAPLIDTMSIAECIGVFRGYPTTGMGRIDWTKLDRDAKALLERFDVPVSPRDLAGKLIGPKGRWSPWSLRSIKSNQASNC